jgi:hypothetical protein
MEFDPDKYLQEDDFDPDEYLGLKEPQKPMTQDEYAGEMGARAWQSVLSPVAEASHFVDRFVGAPIRAGLAETQKERQEYLGRGETNPVFSTRPLAAAWEQFGEDPSRAPTSSQVAEGYGASAEKNIPFATVENFTSPRARFKQQNISAADVLGVGISTATDPINYIPGPNLVGRTSKGLGNVASPALKAQERAIDSFAKTGIGIPEDAYNYYKKYQPRLKGKVYERPDDLRERMIDEANKIRSDHDSLIALSKGTRQDIKEQIKKIENAVAEGQVPDIEEVMTFKDSIKHDGEIQNYLSQQADEALGELDIRFRRKDLENIILAKMEEIPRIADGAAAYAELEKLLAQTRDQYAPLISGPQLREYMQRISSIPNWNMPPGQINSLLDSAVKDFRFKISEFLKNQGRDGSNPSKYEKLMNEMSEKREATKALANYFRSDAQGLNTLKKLRNTNDPTLVQELDRILREYAMVQGKGLIQYADDMAELRRKQKLLDEKEYETLLKDYGDEPGQLYKDPFEMVRDIDATIEMHEPLVGSISKITDKNAENLIKNIGMPHGGSSYNLEQLDALEKMSGVPFEREIKDAGALREFSLDRTRGSKRTTPGTILGSLFGAATGALTSDPTATMYAGTLGGYLGKKAGEALDVRGGQMAKRMLDKNLARQESVEKFVEKMQNPEGKFKKYADVINRMGSAAAAPTRSLVLYHQILWNNDPEYRKALEE